MAQRKTHTLVDREGFEEGFRVMQGGTEYVTYPENASFRMWYAEEADAYDTHTHYAMEAVLVLEGCVQYEVMGQHHEIRKDEMILVPTGTPHSLSMQPGSRRLLFLFEPDALMTMRDIKGNFEILNRVFVLSGDTPVQQEVRRQLIQVSDYYQNHGPMWNTLCYSCLLRIYAALGQTLQRHPVSSQEEPEDERSREKVIVGAMSYIGSHYQEDLSLETVASFCGFSRYYFSRCFRQQTGSTFADYLRETRLKAAVDLLIRTRKSMEEIAKESGFGSIATFYRVFRESKECTPTKYRDIYGTW